MLDEKVEKLKVCLKNQSNKILGLQMINKYPEISWSLLQHYEVCDTPLLDLSRSLHVACSFAQDANAGDTGIVYVLGMPWQLDAVGYNSHEELVNIELLTVCPPQAQRPFFQEGYLVGPFPNYQLDHPQRRRQFDFARRLVAKFKIPNTPDFWDEGFTQIPASKLYPPNDPMYDLCKLIK